MPSWNSDAELNLGCEIGLRNLIGKSGKKQSKQKEKRGGTINADKERRQTKQEDKQRKKTNKKKEQERKKKREKTKIVIRCFGFAFGFASV